MSKVATLVRFYSIKLLLNPWRVYLLGCNSDIPGLTNSNCNNKQTAESRPFRKMLTALMPPPLPLLLSNNKPTKSRTQISLSPTPSLPPPPHPGAVTVFSRFKVWHINKGFALTSHVQTHTLLSRVTMETWLTRKYCWALRPVTYFPGFSSLQAHRSGEVSARRERNKHLST